MNEDLEDLPWLKPYKPRPFFGGPRGVPKKSGPSYVMRRQKKTWAYTVVLEQSPTGAGRIKLFRWDRVSPIATAPFSSRSEGDLLFEQTWEKAQELTEDLNETLK